MKFCTWVCLKRWNDRGEFEFDREKSKKYITENLVAVGYDTIKFISCFSVFYRRMGRHSELSVEILQIG